MNVRPQNILSLFPISICLLGWKEDVLPEEETGDHNTLSIHTYQHNYPDSGGYLGQCVCTLGESVAGQILDLSAYPLESYNFALYLTNFTYALVSCESLGPGYLVPRRNEPVFVQRKV